MEIPQNVAVVLSQESSDWKKLRRGWCWGAKGFREEMLELIAEKQDPQHEGEELHQSAQQMTPRVVGETLREAGWTEEELKRRGKGDARKARMAARLRAETTMTWSWIAKRLEMGHWRTASNAVRRSGSKTRA